MYFTFVFSYHYIEFDIPYSVLTLDYIVYIFSNDVYTWLDIKFDFVLFDFLLQIKLKVGLEKISFSVQ